MGLDLEEDRKRLPVELNMRAARKRQSAQTGYVHHCYESENDSRDTIPVFENICFALALLRTKQSENMQEGLKLLRSLFPFEKEGNFPVYLHEFPACKDRLLGIKLLPALHAIFDDFHSILESSFYEQLQQLIDRVRMYGYSLEGEGSLPLRYAMLLHYDEPQSISSFQATTPDLASDVLIAAHMTRGKGGTPHLEPIIKKWHRELLTYSGAQEQEKTEPKPSLFDLFMSDYSRNYPKRILSDHPMHLRASLVHPLELRCVVEQGDSGCAFQSAERHPVQPYTLYWGSSEHLHSFVCDPKKMRHRVETTANGAEILLTSSAPAALESTIEMAFFYDLHPSHAFFVNGQKATAFQLGDVLEMHSGLFRCQIVFSLVEGEGVFYGHLSRGNRPLQAAAKGILRYEAYDWQIGLRTIKRMDQCSVRASITWTIRPLAQLT